MPGSRTPGPLRGEPPDAGTLALTTHRDPRPTGTTKTKPPQLGPDAGTRIKSVLLSFDDGPEPVAALKAILQILAFNSIKAEFYLLGKEIVSNPGAAALIVTNGHRVQNHSWDHPKLDVLSYDEVEKQLADTQEAIAAATGKIATRVRPPYGAGGWKTKIDPELERAAKKLSLEIHNWDVDTEDWRRPRGIGLGKLSAIRKQLGETHKSERIDILMHIQPETASDLQSFIDKLVEWGYSFAIPL